MSSQYDSTVWNYLKNKIGNEKGVAGIMGNLEHESGMHPDRVQGDVPYSSFSVEYTRKVDSGEVSRNDFIHHGINGGGYGLAQWTYYTRKERLYNLKAERGCSIGDINLGLEYLWWELNNSYPSVLQVCKTCTDIRIASNKVLHDFESPADQSTRVEIARYNSAVSFYNRFAGTGGGSGESGGGSGGSGESGGGSGGSGESGGSGGSGGSGESGGDDKPKQEIWNEIIKTCYNTAQLTEEEVTEIKKLDFDSVVKMIYTRNRRKKEIGHTFTGKRLTFDNKEYNIINVTNNGFITIRYSDIGNEKIINPKYICLIDKKEEREGKK